MTASTAPPCPSCGGVLDQGQGLYVCRRCDDPPFRVTGGETVRVEPTTANRGNWP